MRESRTHFEQVPLDVVKKIVVGDTSNDEKTSADDVILERTSDKREGRTVPPRPLAENGR
jgi:hypothetical protein